MNNINVFDGDRRVNGVLLNDGWIFVDGYYNGNKVTDLIYHFPRGEGDKHFVDIFNGNIVERAFDIIRVNWYLPSKDDQLGD